MLKRIWIALLLCLLLTPQGICRADQQSALAALQAADEEEDDAYIRNALSAGYEYMLGLDFDDADDWYQSYNDTGPLAPNYDVVDFLYDEEDGAEFYLGEVSDHEDQVLGYQVSGSADLSAGWTYYNEQSYSLAESLANSAVADFGCNYQEYLDLLEDYSSSTTAITASESDMASVEAVEMDATSARDDMHDAKNLANTELGVALSDFNSCWYGDYTDAFLRYWTEIEPVHGPDQLTEDFLDAAYDDLDVANTYYDYADGHWDAGVNDEYYSDDSYTIGSNNTTTYGKCTNFENSENEAIQAAAHYDDCSTDAVNSQISTGDAVDHCEDAQTRMDQL